MPLYTYICKECGATFDLLIGVTQQKTDLKCTECGSVKIERTFGTFSMGSSGYQSSGSSTSCPTGTCPLG